MRLSDGVEEGGEERVKEWLVKSLGHKSSTQNNRYLYRRE